MHRCAVGNLICTVNEIRLSEVRGEKEGLGEGENPIRKGVSPSPRSFPLPPELALNRDVYKLFTRKFAKALDKTPEKW